MVEGLWAGVGRPRPVAVEVKLAPGAIAPMRKYEGDAGFDLYSVIADANGCPMSVDIHPGQFYDVGTGVFMALPEGYWAEIRGRSSMAWKKRLVIHPGVIDEGYRGELRVLVQNLGHEKVTISHGERLAQLIFRRREPVVMEFVEELPLSRDGREVAGFGSTGR